MALDIELFKREVQQVLSQGKIHDVEYVMLKIAMELQDKANIVTMLQ